MNKYTSIDKTDSYYLPAKENLQPGDVLLEVGHGMLSKIVQVADGHFSHAMLYLGNGQVAEAVGDGVILIGIDLIYLRDPQDLAVYRMPAGTLNETHLKQIEDAARSRMFSGYDGYGAAQTKLWGGKQQGKFFCSELVAYAYAEAGIELVKGKKPSQVTPNMLAGTSSSLVLISNPAECIEIIPESAEEAKEYAELLNRHKAVRSRVPGKIREADQGAYKKFKKPINKALKKGGYKVDPPFSDNLSYIISVLGRVNLPNGDALSDRVVDYLDQMDYFNIGIDLSKLLIEQCNQAFKHDDFRYISSSFKRVSEKRAAVEHWKREQVSMINMPFQKSIHRRLAVMYGRLVKIAEKHCVLVEDMHTKMERLRTPIEE